MGLPRYFLSSLDSYMLEKPRACDFVALTRFDTGKECVVAVVDPPIPGQSFGSGADISQVMLAARHEGDRLSAISEFPCFVFVARPLVPGIECRQCVTATDMEVIAWGELYRTRDDAERHVFDR